MHINKHLSPAQKFPLIAQANNSLVYLPRLLSPCRLLRRTKNWRIRQRRIMKNNEETFKIKLGISLPFSLYGT